MLRVSTWLILYYLSEYCYCSVSNELLVTTGGIYMCTGVCIQNHEVMEIFFYSRGNEGLERLVTLNHTGSGQKAEFRSTFV